MIRKIYPLLFLLYFVGFQGFVSDAQIKINEYSAANWKLHPDNFQEYEDWIELHNGSSSSVDLSGWFLTDNSDKLMKWEFPAGASIAANGFVRVWCSGRDTVFLTTHFHANFRLTQTKNNPEVISIVRPDGTVEDQLETQKVQKHMSMCRKTDGGDEWMITTSPTPNTSNVVGAKFKAFADRPSMDAAAGFYADSVKVTISTEEPNGVIRYTLNGTEPVASSPIYSGPITVKKTTVIKARTFSPDPLILPSFIQFNTYFINVSHTMVVVSIAADQLQDLANGNQNLRPQGSIEYFGKDKTRKTRSYGELNSHGQDSWANDQRSLDWVSRDEFGYSAALKEKIFAISERDEYQRVILRASGDDNYPAAHHPENRGSAHMRDDYVQTLAKLGGLSLDLRSSERCIVYLNGDYWGVYSFRELPDDHDYTDFYYGQGKYDLQYILTWGNTWTEYGGAKALNDWKVLRTWALTRDMTDPANYKYVTDRLDIQSLVDYFIVNTTAVCSDWLNYNTGWWRGLNPNGQHKKWGYILWDNDATFGFYINYTGVPDTTPTAKPCDIDDFDTNWGSPDPEKHIQLVNKLRANPEFEQFYVSRQADLNNRVYSCENMFHVFDSMVAVIEPEMAMHAARWDGTYDEWQKNVGRLRYFIERRCNLLDDGMVDCYEVTGPYPIHFMVNPPGAGSIQVNTLAPNPYPWQGQYYGAMDNLLKVVPTPGTGLVFDRWESKNKTVTYSPDSALPSVAAQFTAGDTVVALFRSVTPTFEANEKLAALVYPTVFNNETNVEYELTESAEIRIRLLTMLGQEIALFNEGLKNGRQSLRLDFSDLNLSPGTYVLQFWAGGAFKNVRIVKQ